MLTRLNQLFSPAKPAAFVSSRPAVAGNLTLRPDASPRLCPRRAAELRQAAVAYLGVVR